jgi:hypothetical protein
MSTLLLCQLLLEPSKDWRSTFSLLSDRNSDKSLPTSWFSQKRIGWLQQSKVLIPWIVATPFEDCASLSVSLWLALLIEMLHREVTMQLIHITLPNGVPSLHQPKSASLWTQIFSLGQQYYVDERKSNLQPQSPRCLLLQAYHRFWVIFSLPTPNHLLSRIF